MDKTIKTIAHGFNRGQWWGNLIEPNISQWPVKNNKMRSN